MNFKLKNIYQKLSMIKKVHHDCARWKELGWNLNSDCYGRYHRKFKIFEFQNLAHVIVLLFE